MQNNQNFIDVGQLRVGLFIHLDLGWMDHPFTVSNFKVKDEEQISKIKKIGLKKLRYDPQRSDCEPLPVVSRGSDKALSTLTDAPVTADNEQEAAVAALTDQDNAGSIANGELSGLNSEEQAAKLQQEQRAERLRQLHRMLDEKEKKFISVGNVARVAMKNIISQPKQSLAESEQLVNEMVSCTLSEGEIAIHAINGNRSDDKNYLHSLNVTVLSLMMARSLSVSEEDARMLGMAALFHDIGKMEIPDKILMKIDALTKSEQAFYEQHSEFGARIVKQAGMSDRIAKVVLQHHELADGTGYPKHLKLEQTDPLARVISLISSYDNLCNPRNIMTARTPYEALAHMFANMRSKFDEALLKHLIKSLGIYPPGSIVQLSNGLHGIVISVNPNKPLRPFVMVHDALTDRHSPLIIDLREEPSINICVCLRPNQLPEEALNYLNPRKRVSYFIDADLVTSA